MTSQKTAAKETRFNAEEEIFAIRRIECLQLLQPDKRWNVLSSNVCGERAPKYFSRNSYRHAFQTML